MPALVRLFQELAAAPTRAKATRVLQDAEWLADLQPRARESAYEKAWEILAEKTE
jgi:hypothetical protein